MSWDGKRVGSPCIVRRSKVAYRGKAKQKTEESPKYRKKGLSRVGGHLTPGEKKHHPGLTRPRIK